MQRYAILIHVDKLNNGSFLLEFQSARKAIRIAVPVQIHQFYPLLISVIYRYYSEDKRRFQALCSSVQGFFGAQTHKLSLARVVALLRPR